MIGIMGLHKPIEFVIAGSIDTTLPQSVVTVCNYCTKLAGFNVYYPCAVITEQDSYQRIREACILFTGADKDADVLIQGLQVDEAKNGWQKIAFYYKVEKKQVTAHLDNMVE